MLTYLVVVVVVVERIGVTGKEDGGVVGVSSHFFYGIVGIWRSRTLGKGPGQPVVAEVAPRAVSTRGGGGSWSVAGCCWPP